MSTWPPLPVHSRCEFSHAKRRFSGRSLACFHLQGIINYALLHRFLSGLVISYFALRPHPRQDT